MTQFRGERLSKVEKYVADIKCAMNLVDDDDVMIGDTPPSCPGVNPPPPLPSLNPPHLSNLPPCTPSPPHESYRKLDDAKKGRIIKNKL